MNNQTTANAKDQDIELVGRFVRETIEEDGKPVFIDYQVTANNRGWLQLVGAQDDRIETKARRKQVFTGEGSADDCDYTLLPLDYDPETAAEEAEEAATRMAKQLEKYRANYVLGIAASGRKSLHNGDDVAQALESMDVDDLFALVNNLFDIDLRDRYNGLNLGQKRMNLGNRIRAAFKKEEHPQHEAVKQWVAEQVKK